MSDNPYTWALGLSLILSPTDIFITSTTQPSFVSEENGHLASWQDPDHWALHHGAPPVQEPVRDDGTLRATLHENPARGRVQKWRALATEAGGVTIGDSSQVTRK